MSSCEFAKALEAIDQRFDEHFQGVNSSLDERVSFPSFTGIKTGEIVDTEPLGETQSIVYHSEQIGLFTS